MMTLNLVRRTHIPIIRVPDDTFTVATKINNLIVKVRPGDKGKVRASEQLVNRYVKVSRIFELLKS